MGERLDALLTATTLRGCAGGAGGRGGGAQWQPVSGSDTCLPLPPTCHLYSCSASAASTSPSPPTSLPPCSSSSSAGVMEEKLATAGRGSGGDDWSRCCYMMRGRGRDLSGHVRKHKLETVTGTWADCLGATEGAVK